MSIKVPLVQLPVLINWKSVDRRNIDIFRYIILNKTLRKFNEMVYGFGYRSELHDIQLVDTMV